MKRYVGFGIVISCSAVILVLFALITLALAGGDLFADVEFHIPRRRRRGENVIAYPAFVPISSALLYAASVLLSGAAHIRGSKALLVVSTVIGVGAAVVSGLSGVAFGRDAGSGAVAVLFAVVVIAIALTASIRTLRDEKKAAMRDAGPPPFDDTRDSHRVGGGYRFADGTPTTLPPELRPPAPPQP